MIDVEKLAMEAGCDKLEHLTKEDREFLDRFSALVLEAAAVQCEIEADGFKQCQPESHDGRYDWKEDGARDCADAIRAIKPGESNE
jgi:hypothetical protein